MDRQRDRQKVVIYSKLKLILPLRSDRSASISNSMRSNILPNDFSLF